MIAFVDKPRDIAIFADIIKTAPTNFGHNGKYEGVGGHLFAIACNESLKLGYNGYRYLTEKTNLIEYYKNKFDAKVAFGQRMYVFEDTAHKLLDVYFNGETSK